MKIEGNCLSHQVVVTHAKSDKVELQALEKWLRSYEFASLFNENTGFIDDIYNLLPDNGLRMGANKHTYGGSEIVKKLILPDINSLAEDATHPGTMNSSSMRFAGDYLNEVFQLNQTHCNFRMFSPDETYSNKLDKIFDTTTRATLQPKKPWDKDSSTNGRVIEMLSEHSLQGLMQGYVLTGRHAVFASYEAFIQIVSSMTDQYMKFLHVSREFSWRGEIPSLNYILTSSGWRQEHNGFSHQNPGFISNILQKNGHFARAYFPPDANSTLAVLEKCLQSHNFVNVIVAGKTFEPRWLTPELAKIELEQGLMIWDFASDPDPDIVLAGVGDYVSKEALAAITIVKQETPQVKIRFVNIIELSAIGLGYSHSLTLPQFDAFFTDDKPVILNFHGYPAVLQQLLFSYSNTKRFFIHGYVECGSTTTPYDMHIRNRTSRWHLALEVFSLMSTRGIITAETATILHNKYHQKIIAHNHYIKRYGVDPDEITTWQWQ